MSVSRISRLTIELESPLVVSNDVVIQGKSEDGVPITEIKGLTPGMQLLQVASDATVEIHDVAFSAEGDPDHGALVNLGHLHLVHTSHSNHSASAVYNAGTLTIEGSTIRSNQADYGGAIYNLGALTVRNALLERNSANFQGGAMYVIGSEARVTIESTVIVTNEAVDGAGIWNGGTMWVENSLIAGNAASGTAGGIDNEGSFTAWNSTISSNSAIEVGAMRTGPAPAEMELVHCTVVENRAPWVGGLLVEGTMVVRNSIVSINYSKEGRKDVEDAAGGLASEGYNVFGDVAVEGTMPTDRLGGDPGLSGLWYYGGPTMTHSLALYAPAVDHVPAHLCLDPFGNLLDQDQRGEPRPAGTGCDSGAFELQAVP